MKLPVALVALAALTGCGGGSTSREAPPKATSSIVDLKGSQPFVNSLEVEPTSGKLLITTNRGFFRIDPESRRVERVLGVVTAKERSVSVGTFLEVVPLGARSLLGSGHPDRGGVLPQYLGVLRSDDSGRSWRVVSRLGEADLHRITQKHGRLYAFDAVLGAVLVSRDGGRTFHERVAPPEPMVELEVDPADPQRILLASEETMFRSDNGGDSWRPIARVGGARLAWPTAEALYRVERTGAVTLSRDGGGTWQPLGRVSGEGARLKAVDPTRLLLALTSGRILESSDRGRSWKTAFEP